MGMNSNFTFAVHTLVLLAGAEEPMSSSYIAESISTNPVTIRRLMGRLKEAGLVQTTQGIHGGALLACPPEEIPLSNVYQLVKDVYPFGLHPNDPNSDCPVGANIQKTLKKIYLETDDIINEYLSGVSVAGILETIPEPMTE